MGYIEWGKWLSYGRNTVFSILNNMSAIWKTDTSLNVQFICLCYSRQFIHMAVNAFKKLYHAYIQMLSRRLRFLKKKKKLLYLLWSFIFHPVPPHVQFNSLQWSLFSLRLLLKILFEITYFNRYLFVKYLFLFLFLCVSVWMYISERGCLQRSELSIKHLWNWNYKALWATWLGF